MSQLVFPLTLPGVQISITREVLPVAKIVTSESQKEVRIALAAGPRYRFQLSVAGRQEAGGNELKTLNDFVSTHIANWDSFLLDDPFEVDAGTAVPRRRVRFDGMSAKRIIVGWWTWDFTMLSVLE